MGEINWDQVSRDFDLRDKKTLRSSCALCSRDFQASDLLFDLENHRCVDLEECLEIAFKRLERPECFARGNFTSEEVRVDTTLNVDAEKAREAWQIEEYKTVTGKTEIPVYVTEEVEEVPEDT